MAAQKFIKTTNVIVFAKPLASSKIAVSQMRFSSDVSALQKQQRDRRERAVVPIHDGDVSGGE